MVISKRTHNTTSSISQSNHHHHHQQPHQQSDRKLRALKNCSKWNSALLQGRRSRGPQWDYSTASYHIPRNSIAYLTGVTPLDHQSLTQSTSTHQTNQIKPSSPYLSNPSSQSQPHSINSTSTHLLRSSSASIHQLQPIQRPSPHPHPHHQLQSKPSNTLLHDPKFPPFVSVSNHHLPQSNLSTHPGPIPAPSSHFSSTSVSSSTGTHPSGAGPGAGAHLTTRHQISPTGLPHQEQKNEVHPESNHDPSIHGESNLSRHSSIDKSQVHPHPPAPASIRSNASELGSNQTQAYPAFHPSEPSPQFQTQHQPTPLQYPPAPPPPHLIPPPTSPDKLTNQPSPSTSEHPPQLSPIPPPTPQDQSSPSFRSSNQWSPNPTYNPSTLPYPPNHQPSPQFASTQQFPNPTPNPIHKQTPGLTNMKPTPLEGPPPPHHPQYPNPPSTTPTTAHRPIFSPHPHPYPSSSYNSPTPPVLPTPPPPNPNFKTVASFSGINHPNHFTNLQQIQQQQQAQIAIKNQQAQLMATTKVKPIPTPSALPQPFSPGLSQPPPQQQSVTTTPTSSMGYGHPAGYLKTTGGGADGFGNPMGFGTPAGAGGYMGYNPTKPVHETGVGVGNGNGSGSGEVGGNGSVSPDGT